MAREIAPWLPYQGKSGMRQRSLAGDVVWSLGEGLRPLPRGRMPYLSLARPWLPPEIVPRVRSSRAGNAKPCLYAAWANAICNTAQLAASLRYARGDKRASRSETARAGALASWSLAANFGGVASPNMYALIGGNVIDIARLYPECGVPLINIASGTDGTKGAG
jgi:hypothetical protein